MLKKIMIFTTALLLSACVAEQSPIPAEFAAADYQLSDAQAKQWIAASNAAEKCIYPNLTRIQQEHFKKEDSYIYSQYVFFYPLEEIIGADMVRMIEQDQKSMDYVTYQRKKFKNSVKGKSLDVEACEVLRKQARDDLAVVKGEYRDAMAEEQKSENKANGASSLDKGKFSFDILKWGVSLMLL